LHRVEAKSVLRVDLKIGTRFPVHTSAIGQAILATLPETISTQELDSLSLAKPEYQRAQETINAARKLGYAIVRDTPVVGINAIAVAIPTRHRRAMAG